MNIVVKKAGLKDGFCKKTGWSPFILAVIIPVLIYYSAVYWYPVLCSIYASLTNWDLSAPNVFFTGINNYVELFKDENFTAAFMHTVVLSLYVVPAMIIFSFIAAVTLDSLKMRLRNTFVVLYFLPAVTSMVVVSTVWKWLFHPTLGIVNYIIGWVGIPPSQWLNNSKTVLLSIAIVMVWKGIGFNSVIFLTGLQNIPSSLYEAAKIDGANFLHRIFYIIIPMLKKTSVFIVTTCIISSMTTFTQIYVLTNGGPGGASRTIPYYIYESAIRYQKMGYASSMAIILFVFIMVVTYIQLKFSKDSWEY